MRNVDRNHLKQQNMLNLPLKQSQITSGMFKINSRIRGLESKDKVQQSPLGNIMMEVSDYTQLQNSLDQKLSNILQNIKVCKEKSKIKDKEMQSMVEMVQKIDKRIVVEEKKAKSREKTLQRFSFRCHQLTTNISGEQQQIKNEAIILHQESVRYSALQQAVSSIEQVVGQSQLEVERRQALYLSLGQVQQENSQLRQQYTQLLNEEKLIDYREQQDEGECQLLEKKVEHLQKVFKDRSNINKSNSYKLVKLSRQVDALEQGLRQKHPTIQQAKQLQLQIGDLNQELLLLNNNISELDSKVRRKRHLIQQLRVKLYGKERKREHQDVNREVGVRDVEERQFVELRQPPKHPKPSPQRRQQRPNYQLDLSHLTPTFPSNELSRSSEPHTEGSPLGSKHESAHDNIQKLIKRYQRMKKNETE